MANMKNDKSIEVSEKYYEEGQAHYKRSSFKRAANAYRMAISFNILNVKAYDRLSQALCRLDDYEGAADALIKATAIEPDDAWRYYYLGYASYYCDRLDDCREAFTRAGELAPADARLFAEIGLMYFENDDDDCAFEAMNQAVNLSPSNYEYRVFIAYKRYARGEYLEAVPHYRAAVALEPGVIPNYVELADCLHKIGEKEAALATYELATELVNAGTAADEYMLIGLGCVTNGYLAQAVSVYERLIRVSPCDCSFDALLDARRALKLQQEGFAKGA
jgi:tetratricopeptide (TPR) repeat protein